MVEAALAAGLCSGRKACRMMKLARSTLRYRAGVRSDARTLIVKRMHELSEANPRYGYRRIAALLRREGWLVGKRQIRRLRRQEGLRVPPSKKKVVRARDFDGVADEGGSSRTRVDVGLHRGLNRPGRSPEDAHGA